MTISGNQLLSALGSGILPSEGSHAKIKHDDGLSFEEILGRVQRGEPSEIGIEIGKDVLPTSVSIQDRQQVGRAADLASMQGIQRAVVDLGKSFVRLDVKNRVLEAQLEPEAGQVIDQIDGFVSMRPPEADSEEPVAAQQAIRFTPARIVRNTSLADVLSARIE